MCLINTHTKALKVYRSIKYNVEWLLTNLTKRMFANTIKWEDFLLKKLQKETFCLFKRLRKMKALKDFQPVEFQCFFFVFKTFYRLQNLAIMTSDFEPKACRSNGLKLEGEAGYFLSQQASTSSRRKTSHLSHQLFRVLTLLLDLCLVKFDL